MPIIALIQAGFKAIAAIFGFGKTVQQEKNTPAMQANAEAKNDAEAAEKGAADAANPDPKAFEQDIS